MKRDELVKRLEYEKQRNIIKDPNMKQKQDEALDHAIITVQTTLADPKPRKKRILCPDCTPGGTDT